MRGSHGCAGRVKACVGFCVGLNRLCTHTRPLGDRRQVRTQSPRVCMPPRRRRRRRSASPAAQGALSAMAGEACCARPAAPPLALALSAIMCRKGRCRAGLSRAPAAHWCGCRRDAAVAAAAAVATPKRSPLLSAFVSFSLNVAPEGEYTCVPWCLAREQPGPLFTSRSVLAKTALMFRFLLRIASML